jgi:hypothetical protein
MYVFDLYKFERYGVHLNEVVGITEEGYRMPWPTGETPLFAQVSTGVFVLAFWVSAVGVYSLRFAIGRSYHGKICRGTE